MIHINHKEKALVDGNTGEIVRPHCWDTLIPYVNYLEGRAHGSYAQSILKQVMSGEKVISKMIEQAQKHGIGL